MAGEPALVGNHRLIEERGLCNAAIHSKLDALAASGRTAVLVARQGRPLGIIALADRTRESARDAIEMLRRQGVQRVVMLTGDNHASAEALARELGVDETHAELLPHDKVAVVHEAADRRTARSRWWATASTTRRRWPRPTSASRWARPAQTRRSKPRTSR